MFFFSNCLQTCVRFVYDSLVTIYSENAVLLALSLCCFIHAVKYMMPLISNLIVTVSDHCLSSTLRPKPYISNTPENWYFLPKHHMGKENKHQDDIK